MAEKILMKGNEAIAHGAIRCGCDGYFGYPITPQSEVMETLMEQQPWETTGMVVLQAESETSSINMVYGGAATGKKVMTSSSSLGISLMCEGLSYLAGAELPCVIVNVMRGGPGLGTIQPSQSDYFQAVKGGGHGDYKMIVIAPASAQDMYDFVEKGFDLAFKYRIPTMILSDGVIGQMMEKVELGEMKPRWTEAQIREKCPWAVCGKSADRKRNVITSLALDAHVQEAHNIKLQAKYKEIIENEQQWSTYRTEDAEYLLVGYGSMSRIGEAVVDAAREEGYKVGIVRPITLFPFPEKPIKELLPQLKGILTIEMSAGQMVEDVKLTANGAVPVHFYGRTGGIIPAPEEIMDALVKIIKG
ncbi:MAG: 3-methyl-2-oxobutanoate dehydrogenase subunit VorB [Bacteroidales bacterium]|mgnify:CR=1 FL=1|jgi:2-oxoglutarate ferredoxin oxidoreductase subunit alpha|nr:3-methyl-2-oxobutanoate dehydrogenase subunit VorB [Bacteroidales bacterium]MBQ1929094.1 3-methyl-2-oxobutanoate dehydrogenase subunit VorB [Bacteroidales bacterium]MBQ5784251.1 3-methyl-2-oxobutanoate dehydrogenase subunit VorB [Bacteroidales bacterium]